MKKFKHLLMVPFTGLGLYNGFRGNAWLKNRIKIFKQFVVHNLQQQTNKNFTLWISWRREERKNPQVAELLKWLREETVLNVVFTYSGVCFYDDKHEDNEARERLMMALHGAMPELMDSIGDCDEVIMSIQPSDDVYHVKAVEAIQNFFILKPKAKAVGFTKGYICNYLTKEVKEYNPETNPPFYSIRFTRKEFTGLPDHTIYTSLKHDVGKYKAGTPLPSHEYLPDVFPGEHGVINDRGFVVGVHGKNISTHFNLPYAGVKTSNEVLKDFALYDIEPLKIYQSLGNKVFWTMPHRWQRKLRYLAGEKRIFPFTVIYNVLR